MYTLIPTLINKWAPNKKPKLKFHLHHTYFLFHLIIDIIPIVNIVGRYERERDRIIIL